jgi:D-alanyl-D-alanine carboxypeptidase
VVALTRSLLVASVVVPSLVVASLVVASPEPASAGEPAFRARVERIDARTRRLMTGRSWHRGCPVPIRDLRLLSLRFWGFDRAVHHGHLVVHRRYAGEMVRVFRRLFRARFPLRRMRLVDRYGGDDLRSMKADNTSAFNCRWRAGSPGVWSQHAYGRAIDLNPVENPYVVADHVSPPAGRRFVDRSRRRRGMIHRHDAVVRAFRSVAWRWGGRWRRTVDYQHFSSNGR